MVTGTHIHMYMYNCNTHTHTIHHHLDSVKVDSSIVSEISMSSRNHLFVEFDQTIYCSFSAGVCVCACACACVSVCVSVCV